MNSADWKEITVEDVFKAIEVYKNTPTHNKSRSTFLIYKNEEYDAKALRWFAYKVHFGREISTEEFQGGNETKRFFEKLGFEVKNYSENKMIKIMKKCELKVGLYVEDVDVISGYEDKMDKSYYKCIEKVKHSDIDLLVFPESCHLPKSVMGTEKFAEDITEDISKELGKAVIVGFCDNNGSIFNCYSNYYAQQDETKSALYYKHIFVPTSAFDFEDYSKNIKEFFPIINLKGYKLGMTICYDCTQPVFSRMYGINDVDILINSTGSDVNQRKWRNNIRTRGIENNCYSLCVCGYSIDKEINKHKESQGIIATGFNEHGAELSSKSLFTGEEVSNDNYQRNDIYVIDFSLKKAKTEENIIPQLATVPKVNTINIQIDKLNFDSSDKFTKIDEGLYIQKKSIEGVIHSLVFCVIEGDNIKKPEYILSKLYNPKLEAYTKKRYFLINQYNSDVTLNDELMSILATRTTENYITVLLESKNEKICLQPTKTKGLQQILNQSNKYTIDIERAKGIDVVWKKNTDWRMSSDWLPNYKRLIEIINGIE